MNFFDKTQNDPFVRHIADIKAPLGMSPYDFAKRSGGPSLSRIFEMTNDSEQKEYVKPTELILCHGAAVGLDVSDRCQHMHPGLNFLGFLEGQNENKAIVRTRGSIVLKIDGLIDADYGKAVFCDGPNSFTREKKRGSFEIGRIKNLQDGRATVAFRRYNDEKPLNLDI